MSTEQIDIKFACPHCNQTLEAPLEMAGTTIDCPGCDKPIVVPKSANQTVIQPALPSTPIPNPPSPENTATPRNMTGIVIGVVSVVVIAIAVFLILHAKKPDASTLESQKSESISDSLSSLNDNKTFDYIKAKLGVSQSPVQNVKLLKSYIAKFPSGKHIGEAMALLEDAQAKASVSSISLDCYVVTKGGQSIPVVGWIQIISTEKTRGQIWMQIEENRYWKSAQQQKAIGKQLYPAQEGHMAADEAKENNDISILININYALQSLKAKAVSTLELYRGQASFSNLRPGYYFIYGAGHAGQKVVVYFSEFKAEPGKSSKISPEPLFSFYTSKDDSEPVNAASLAEYIRRFAPYYR